MATPIRRFKLEKLVRDNIEKFFLDSNALQVNKTILKDDEFMHCLHNKIVEEAQEVVDAKTPSELIDECADLVEVIDALLTLYKKNWNDVNEARIRKASTRGVYEKRLYINSVDLPDGSDAAQYFSSNPTKYPEVSLNTEDISKSLL